MIRTHMHWIGWLCAIALCIVGVLFPPKVLHDIPLVETVSSAIREAVSLEPQTTKVLFLGDMMFDRYIRQTIRNKGDDHVFECIKPVFDEADLIVGNLEGPITTYLSVSEGSIVGSPQNFQFTFPTSTATMLWKHNIRLVNLGNNHGRDFGARGVTSTRNALTDMGVNYFGGFAGDSPVYRTTSNGVELSFVNYNQFGGDAPDVVAETIHAERSADRFVIVYTHWGEEYAPVTDRVRQIATQFIDAGAQLIIGSHPHVVQANEMIGTTPVYYSLGNFIFDQYWTKAVSHGLAVLVTITDEGAVTIEERPTQMLIDGRVCPV